MAPNSPQKELVTKEGLLEEIQTIIGRFKRPKKAVVTGGMPYANGPLHIGHLAGAHIPPDIYARWLKMFIGDENVLFVCGTDDHGSTSELSARAAGKSVPEFIEGTHARQKETLLRYQIGLDVYSGTSREETYESHKNVCQEIIRALYRNDMLEKRTSKQWYDTEIETFLPDRYVSGVCPSCEKDGAYSDQCDSCGAQYEPSELHSPKSSLSSSPPELRDTTHWWLNMWKLIDDLHLWISGKQRDWRKRVFTEAIGQVAPCLSFSNTHEKLYKEHKGELPRHKSRYAPGKKVVLQFESLADIEKGQRGLETLGITNELIDGWAHRSITRDIQWGIPLPVDLDSDMQGKTFYVWPESLIAPIGFTMAALKAKGRPESEYGEYWLNPEAKIAQFIGVDNIFFYVVMQGALWLGSQKEVHRMPVAGELQMTDVYSNCHLQINGEKMSKSTGNFYTGDQLLDEFGFSSDQIRYYLSQLSLPKKESNFDIEQLKEKAEFLASPMNSAFERTISAAHSKFNSQVPDGKFIGKTAIETRKIIQSYMRSMERAEYPDLLFLIENYIRLVNKLFATYKPHDDRFPEDERTDALFSSFFIVKTAMILLYPFVPTTMTKLREALNLPEEVFSIEELGKPIKPGTVVGAVRQFFPLVPGGVE